MRLFFLTGLITVFLGCSSVAFAHPIVEIQTSVGTIAVELYEDKAPKTVENFIHYVNEGFYTNTIFHRVISKFMIQGGGMDVNMREKNTSPPIINEADNGLGNEKYTIAMARTSNPNSATSQFFINTNLNSFLNFTSKTAEGYGYCVFGKVVEGLDIVDKIEGSRTQTVGYHENVPVTPILIEKAILRQ